jgi:predicted transporter
METNTNTTTTQPKPQSNFLSPTGAVITIICFFLPWAKGCGGSKASATEIGGVLWLVLFAAIAILVIFFIHHSNNEDHKAKPIITISALVGLGAIIAQVLISFNQVKHLFSRAEIGDMIEFMDIGAFGAILGLILALVGGMALSKRKEEKVDLKKE